MTSSSDTEFCKRRIFVDGLPFKCSTSDVRSIFAEFGAISFVHLTKNGYGFVTFEEEKSARDALAVDGVIFKDCKLKVQVEAGARLPLPVIAAKRDVYFPKPFGGRGPSNFPPSSSHHHGSHHRDHRNNSGNSANSSSSASASSKQRSGSRGQRLERRSNSQQNVVKVIHCAPTQLEIGASAAATIAAIPDAAVSFPDGLPERYGLLFSTSNFPHVSQKIFSILDSASLLRCRLVCRRWQKSVDKVLESVTRKEALLQNWQSVNCSIYPLSPEDEDLELIKDNSESRYRNVLSLKADEREIMLAVDNGNVEIYDRFSLKLTCVLAGQYSASPVKLDCNSKFIFVSYTCAFAGSRRRYVPSAWWNIYCRETKRLLRSIDRDNAVSAIDLHLSFDNVLFLINNSAVYGIDVMKLSRPQTIKVIGTHLDDKIEAVDFDSGKVAAVVKRDRKLVLHVWRQPSSEDILHHSGSEAVDIMTRLEVMFDLLQGRQSELNDNSYFDEEKCQCLSLQMRYPLCSAVLSNNRGFYEYLGERGKPYVLIAIANVVTEQCLRVLTLDSVWMVKMSEALVPYDGDTCVLTAKFDQEHLAVGFGSFSDSKDGAIALWKMDDILNSNIPEADLSLVTSLPSPVYHWAGWDGHIGGVSGLHIDRLGLVAVNSCRHRVTTRCIERGDESRKDNVLVYDFWRPGQDLRREQR